VIAPRAMPDPDLRRRNTRTALLFLSIALIFFFGVIAAHLLGSDSSGMVVLGLAIVVFLAVAIARSVRSRS